MRRWTREQLARSTLRRQFPSIRGRGPAAVLDLFDRIGPVQSQVPRSPFLAASSRLPGVSYATVSGLLEDHRLTKASTLRGTVHTSTADRAAALDAVARSTRAAPMTRTLGLQRVTPAELTAEIERFCRDTWRTRDEVVAHGRGWLAQHESPAVAEAVVGIGLEAYLWGHSGLLRRPHDGAWERRTDSLRRTASALLDLRPVPVEEALVSLVRRHLAAYGPLLAEDLVFFFGVTPRQVAVALGRLGDEVTRLRGPDSDAYLDLADPPAGGRADPGLRLLAEFDGLLLGFQGRHRTRFLSAEQLPLVWASVNGLFSPLVLDDGRIVATWRTVTRGRRTDLEVTMLPPHRPLATDRFDAPAADLARVLPLTITDVQVRRPS